MHGNDLGVGSAVARTLEGADRGGIGGVGVGCRGREHAAGERRVVAAAVLGVQHHHDIEQHGFVMGEIVSATQDLQDAFGGGEVGGGLGNLRHAPLALGDACHVGESGDAR